MNIQFFLDLFDKPLYKMCELHRPDGVLPYSRAKIYKDLRSGEFPQGIDIGGTGRVWTKQMLAEELLRRYQIKNKLNTYKIPAEQFDANAEGVESESTTTSESSQKAPLLGAEVTGDSP